MKKKTNFTTDVKRQHTVPRFLLEHFSFNKQLFTYDKHENKIFRQSILNATVAHKFYNIENHPENASLESFFLCDIVEGKAATAIKKIIENKSVATLTPEEIRDISVFVIVQKSRTDHALQLIKALMKPLSDKIIAIGSNPEDFSEVLSEENSTEQKNLFLRTILEHRNLYPKIATKKWVLYETTKENPFYISDNPISLYHKNIKMGLGLSVEGIRIHLPISSTLTLAFMCPSLYSEESYVQQNPINISVANVQFLNSLQVEFSERFLFCEKNNFKLVEEMLADNDIYRNGIRPKFSFL